MLETGNTRPPVSCYVATAFFHILQRGALMSGCRDPMCSSEFCGNFSSVVIYHFFPPAACRLKVAFLFVV